MLIIRSPGFGSVPARSNSPSMLFMWTPVPGMTTFEPLPVDADSAAALPAESSTLMCVVPPTSPSARVTPRSRARAWSSITSASSATASGEPASPGSSSRRSPYAIRTPPEDGGGFETNSAPR